MHFVTMLLFYRMTLGEGEVRYCQWIGWNDGEYQSELAQVLLVGVSDRKMNSLSIESAV